MHDQVQFFMRKPWVYDAAAEPASRDDVHLGFDTRALHAGFHPLDDIRAFVAAVAVDMVQIKMPDLGGIHNAVEAVRPCKAAGVGAFLGGSYAETDLSARVSVHVALATGADLLLARPGLGVDEAISLTLNEMTRVLAAIHESRHCQKGLAPTPTRMTRPAM